MEAAGLRRRWPGAHSGDPAPSAGRCRWCPAGLPVPAAHPSLGCAFPTARFNSEEVCTCPQASVPEQFASVPWNSFSRDVLEALYGFAPISVHCNKSSAVRFQVRGPAGAQAHAARAPRDGCPPLCARGSLGPTGDPGVC